MKRGLTASLARLLLGAGIAVMLAPCAWAATIDVMNLNNEGVQALNKGQFLLAIALLEETCRRDPSYDMGRENLAIGYDQYARSIIEGSPSDALPNFHRSLYLRPGSGSASQNIEATIRSMHLDPYSFADRVALADRAFNSGDSISAFIEYSEAMKLRKDAKVQARLTQVENQLLELKVPYRFDPSKRNFFSAVAVSSDSNRTRITTSKRRGPPSQEEISKLDFRSKDDLLKADLYAQDLEQVGNYDKAIDLHEQILAALTTDQHSDVRSRAARRSAVVRVQLFKALKQTTDPSRLTRKILDCLNALDTTYCLFDKTRISLFNQLANETMQKSPSFTQLCAAIRKTDEIGINTKLSFTNLLVDAARRTKQPADSIHELREARASLEELWLQQTSTDDSMRRALKCEIRGDYPQAMQIYKACLKDKESSAGKESAEALVYSIDIGRVQAALGQTAEAKATFEQAMRGFRRLGKQNSHEYMRLLEVYGDMLNKADQKHEAEVVYREATEIWMRSR